MIDAAGKTLYPGLVDGLTTLGLTEIGSVAGSVDTTEVGDVNPHAKAWVAVHPHSELHPGRPRERPHHGAGSALPAASYRARARSCACRATRRSRWS